MNSTEQPLQERIKHELTSIKEEKLFHPGSDKLLRHTKLGADGKLIVWQERYQANGQLLRSTELLKNGQHQTQFFGKDGKPILAKLNRLIRHKDGSGSLEIETVLHNQSGVEPRAVYSWTAGGEITEEKYFPNGKPQQKAQRGAKDNKLTCTVYRLDGTAQYRQYFEIPDNGRAGSRYGYGYYLVHRILKAEVFAADGTTVTKEFSFKNHGELDQVRILEDDGNTRVLTFGDYGQGITSEQLLDKDGSLIGESSTDPQELETLLADRYDYLTSAAYPSFLNEQLSLLLHQ